MGTTESTLNHGEEGSDKVRPSISPSKHSIQTSGHATPRSVGTVSTASSRNNLHIPRAIQTNGTVSPNIKPSGKRIQSPISTNSISIGSTTSPMASAKQMPKRQLSILKGIVCGHEGSGKSSLMYRLRGEEHIPQNKQNIKKKVMALIPWSANSAFSDPDANAGTEKVDAISNGNMKNDVVQLHIVERHEKDYSTWVTRSKVDFVIILVDRTNQESLEAAVAIFKSIESYFANDEKEKSNDNMLSICILLNHYDKSVIPKDAKNETSTDEKKINLITLEDVKSAMGRRTVDKIQVKYLETCMKIGYGLEALNSFISLPYLQKKREELMKQLEQVNHGLNTWETNFSKQCFVTYQEIYEAQRSSTVDTSSSVNENKKEVRDQKGAVKETSVSLVNEASKPNDKDMNSINNQSKTTHTERRSIIHGNGNKSLSNMDKSDKIKPSKKLETAAKIASKKQTKRKSGKSISKKYEKKVSKKEIPVYKDPKEALEAFLASDDDDDDIQYSKTTHKEMRINFSAKTKHHATNSAVLDSDSEDSSVSSSYYIQSYEPTLSKARDKSNDTTSGHEYESHATENDEEESKEVQDTTSSKEESVRDVKETEKSQDLSISSTESTPNVNENATSVRKNCNKEIQETVVEDESSMKEISDDNRAETEERQKCDVEYDKSVAENVTTESELTTKEKKDCGEKCSVHKEIPSEIEVEKIPDLDDNTAQIESSRSDDEVGGQEVIQRDIALEGDKKQDSTKETQIQSTDVISSAANDEVQVSRLEEEPVEALQNCKCDKVDETSTSIDSLRSKIDQNELDEDEDTHVDLDTVTQEEILPPDNVDDSAEASIVEGDNFASNVQIEIKYGESSMEEKSENEEVSKDEDQQDQHSMLSEENTARASKFTNQQALVFDEESDVEDVLLQKNIQVIDSDSDDDFIVGTKDAQAHTRNRIYRSDLKNMQNVEAHTESVQENHSTPEVSLSANVNDAIQAALAAAQKNAEKASKPKKSKKSKKSSSSSAVEKKKKKKKKKSVVVD
ncbi:predicted protein [Chaetoceros tenuissimus]|uniref:Uncharacterized protein n=1 Tax=Chaetoceros tenuissimus TaxID=426638 RepID=A0AAD3DBM3_9STRA|nr:predicted protein [Chaetoceros tenuissimus]